MPLHLDVHEGDMIGVPGGHLLVAFNNHSGYLLQYTPDKNNPRGKREKGVALKVGKRGMVTLYNHTEPMQLHITGTDTRILRSASYILADKVHSDLEKIWFELQTIYFNEDAKEIDHQAALDRIEELTIRIENAQPADDEILSAHLDRIFDMAQFRHYYEAISEVRLAREYLQEPKKRMAHTRYEPHNS